MKGGSRRVEEEMQRQKRRRFGEENQRICVLFSAKGGSRRVEEEGRRQKGG